MILCFRFLLWDVASPAGHRWRWPVALLHTLTPQCVHYHPGAVSASLGCSGGDSLSFICQSLFKLSAAPACALCHLFCCQPLVYVSNPVVIHSGPCERPSPLSSALSVSLACVSHLVVLVTIHSSFCCLLSEFALRTFTWHSVFSIKYFSCPVLNFLFTINHICECFLRKVPMKI